MRTLLWMIGAALAVALGLLWWMSRPPSVADMALGGPPFSAEEATRGEYVFRTAGCRGCHTDEDNDGALLAGGRVFNSPFGTFYSPNITPDEETGIGRWSVDDLARSLRYGVAPDGRRYYPAFPYTSYTAMTASDIRALYAYLRTVPPIRQVNQAQQPVWYASRFAIIFWQALYFEPGEYQPDPNRSTAWNRGAYLVTALGHCGECHTPRNEHGAMQKDQFLAGTEAGYDGDEAPNITASKEHGLGDWYADDVDYFLESGMLPDGDFVGGHMAEVIDHSLIHLSAEDRRAMVSFLLDRDDLE